MSQGNKGARSRRHGRYVVFQLAEVAVPRGLFDEILQRMRSASTAAMVSMVIVASRARACGA
jgi:hypothetical protein